MSKSNAAGTKLYIDNVKVGGINNLDGVEIEAEDIDVTDFDNESAYREFLAGFKTVEDLTFSGFLDGDDNGQQKAYDKLDSGELVAWKVVFPSKIGKTWQGNGVVKGFKTSAEVGDAIAFEGKIKVSGKPELVATPVSAG